MNKYHFLQIGLLLLFIVLLLSGFTYTSIYHGIISLWVFMFSGFFSIKAHFIKNPQSQTVQMKKYAYAGLLFVGIICSIAVSVLTNNPPDNSSLFAKLIISGFNSFIILLAIGKLYFHWHRLSFTFIATAFMAIFVLAVSIVIFWYIL